MTIYRTVQLGLVASFRQGRTEQYLSIVNLENHLYCNGTQNWIRNQREVKTYLDENCRERKMLGERRFD